MTSLRDLRLVIFDKTGHISPEISFLEPLLGLELEGLKEENAKFVVELNALDDKYTVLTCDGLLVYGFTGPAPFIIERRVMDTLGGFDVSHLDHAYYDSLIHYGTDFIIPDDHIQKWLIPFKIIWDSVCSGYQVGKGAMKLVGEMVRKAI